MKRRKIGTWWGLYALMPLSMGLLYLTAIVRVAAFFHAVLFASVAVVVALLALLWSEKHADLMGSQGVNAQAEEDSLAAAGFKRGRYAPSLTGRQAHYRYIMLARTTDRSPDRRR